MTREEIKDFCDMKAQLEPENEDIYKAIVKTLEQELTTKNDLGDDCVRRKAVLNTLERMDKVLDEDRTVDSYKELLKECYKVLSSVTPQEPNTWSLDDAREDFMHDVYNTLDFLPTNEEANRIIDSFDRVTSSIEQAPKKGHWVTRPHVFGVAYCSECGFELKINNTNFCPNCGADMREGEE